MRRPVLVGSLVVVAILLIWMVAGAVTALAAYGDLRDSRGELRAAASSLRAAELAEAEAHLGTAVDSATTASARLGGPALWPFRVTPIVASNLSVARAMSDGVRDVGAPAVRLLAEAGDIVHDRSQNVELGTVPLDYLERVQDHLGATDRALEATVDRVVDPSERWLVGPVREARADFLALAEPATAQLSNGVALTEAMPTFLGRDEPRRYLVMASALSELRGSTGLLGAHALLEVDDGRLELSSFEDTTDLPVLDSPVEGVGDWYRERWGALGGDRYWANVNLTPDFPSAAAAMIALWEARPDAPPVDGVILTDTMVYEALVERSGELEVPGIVTLTRENVLEFVGVEAYAAFDDQDERKRILGAVATGAFQRLIALLEDGDVPATVEMLSDLAGGGHLVVYSQDREVQERFVHAGIAGQLDTGDGEFAGVVVNNVAGNKVDYFTERTVEHHVVLRADGSTTSQVTAEFDNHAPLDGMPRHVLGPWTDRTEAGDNLSFVTFLCGRRCEVTSEPRGAVRRGEERGLPATDLRVLVPGGQSRSLRFETRTPQAWQEVDGAVELTVDHRRQPTVAAQEVVIRVAIPPDLVADDLPDGASIEGDEVVWHSDERVRDITLRYRFVPAPTPS